MQIRHANHEPGVRRSFAEAAGVAKKLEFTAVQRRRQKIEIVPGFLFVSMRRLLVKSLQKNREIGTTQYYAAMKMATASARPAVFSSPAVIDAITKPPRYNRMDMKPITGN
jgi:hypothetical protein